MIKRRINATGSQETNQKENQDAEDSFPDPDELVARAELSIFINEVSEEEINIVNELNEFDL